MSDLFGRGRRGRVRHDTRMAQAARLTASLPDWAARWARHRLSRALIVSYGMPKSASTFAWLIIKDVLVSGGAPVVTLSDAAKGNPAKEDFVERLWPDRLAAIRGEVGDGCAVVKTHGLTVRPGEIEEAGFERAIVFVQHRDPRDVALSLIDHGRRSRAEGVPDFAQCTDVPACFPVLDHAIRALEGWARHPNAVPVDYDSLCFDTEATIARIAATCGLHVDPARIAARYAERERITQFNKGKSARWREEMSPRHAELLERRYSGYYRRFGAGDGAA